MTTELNSSVLWQKTLSLDRQQQHFSYIFNLDKSDSYLNSKNQENAKTNSLKRQVFTNLTNYNNSKNELMKRSNHNSRNNEKKKTENKKSGLIAPTTTTTTNIITPMCNNNRKISFKIKKTSSFYRKNSTKIVSTTQLINSNKVSELTMKFNEMIIDNNQKNDLCKLIKRVNSQRSLNNNEHVRVVSVIKANRKPSVKTKPSFLLNPGKLIKNSAGTIKPNSDDLITQNFKCLVIEQQSTVSVRDKIEIFERRNAEIVQSPKDIVPVSVVVPKPNVPERKCHNQCQEKTDFSNAKTDNLQLAQVQAEDFCDTVQILSIPSILPQRRCDSMYETTTLRRISLTSTSNENLTSHNSLDYIKPNTSFLWSRNQQGSTKSLDNQNFSDDWKSFYDIIDPPAVIQQEIVAHEEKEDKIYEELNIKPTTIVVTTSDGDVDNGYEYCETSQDKYEDLIDSTNDYEYCGQTITKENIYETLPTSSPPLLPPKPKQQLVPLPARPTPPPPPPPPLSNNSYCTIQNDRNEEIISNCYESIYNIINDEIKFNKLDYDNNFNNSNYESINGSNRNSFVSSDQQSNSLYGRSSFLNWGDDINSYTNNTNRISKAVSDLSSSDRSDDWVDMSDNENNEQKNSEIVIIREKQRIKKTGWSKQCREQWSKSPKKLLQESDTGAESDSDHHYESLYLSKSDEKIDNECCYNDDDDNDDYDSFDTDTESESSFTKLNLNDSGVDIGNNQLPEPPTSQQTYVLTRLAATAGKHMRKLRRNWSLTKNDIGKSLSRMTKKRKSRTDLETAGGGGIPNIKNTQDKSINKSSPENYLKTSEMSSYQNIEFSTTTTATPVIDQSCNNENKDKTLTRRGFLNKFRRSMSMSAESANELTTNLDNKRKSTFYLTEDIDIDGNVHKDDVVNHDSGVSLSPVQRKPVKSKIKRPNSQPPPIPQNIDVKKDNNNKKDKFRSTSWYADVGLFKNSENSGIKQRPNTFWYAEVGLYQTQKSTPSTSSAENSGNNVVSIKGSSNNFINQENSEAYYNLKNDSNYYNTGSLNSFSSVETKKDELLLNHDIQLRLQDEPLYQFYDAAVLESVCHDGISDFDSDGYEEVSNKSNNSNNSELRLSSRPSAMELVSPANKNSVICTRTLWCEIPEVIQSAVLSTLSSHQKKLQEAKFEMLTSEASYLNSLNVLNYHFIKNLQDSEIINSEEVGVLFGKVNAVKHCSEKLLLDLEKCWQDNILLHGVCDIIQKHAEENFYVYVSYCENQILLDETLKKIREKPGFNDLLRQLESNSACQSLTLYSFLMLPMQRVTRWPLLVDAVLKRLAPQDPEYLTCQYALATVNKIVSQCNEGARNKERENELKKIATQLEFAKGVQPIEIFNENRWLIRSGLVTQMQQRTDEIKLTFGKRFIKIPLHLFLFNDVLFVTKSKSENVHSVIHYCARNLVELTSTDTIMSLPVKETQGRHLLFLTILQNQNDKTVEFLLSCSSESDKERWIEALTPPKSEDPDETLYECWDCPQVTVVHNYITNQPDELALNRGDIINVLRKMADGWYHGERIRDGQLGWFPANYTKEIANPHVRSRNLKQRYRLLAYSENYLKNK